MKWLKILLTKKGFNKSKKSQYLFNEMFKPYTAKEVRKIEIRKKKEKITY